MQSEMPFRENCSASPRLSVMTLWKSSSITGTMALVGYVMYIGPSYPQTCSDFWNARGRSTDWRQRDSITPDDDKRRHNRVVGSVHGRGVHLCEVRESPAVVKVEVRHDDGVDGLRVIP